MPDISRRAKTLLQQKAIDARNKDSQESKTSFTNRTVFNDAMALVVQYVDSYETISFQFVPENLKVNREVNQQPIQIIARNIPRRQYTGGDVSYSFTLYFHAETENRLDVIQIVKYIESLTYTDGDNEDVPKIQLIWGNIVDSSYTFVISELSYTFAEFGGEELKEVAENEYETEQLYNPRIAQVNITLARVSDKNLTWEDVRS